MSEYVIAGVQMDVLAGDPDGNLAAVLEHAENAYSVGADLVVFPECAITGYCFDSLDEALQHALERKDPRWKALQEASRQLELAIMCGTLLREPTEVGQIVRNSVLTFHQGQCVDVYHKIHLPFLGVDRFVTPGNALHKPLDLDGLRVGIHICYEGGFPEVARSLSLDGADLVVLPTNWPPGSGVSWEAIPACRALENRVYFMAVNRIGTERGTEFIGHSSVCGVTGEAIATAQHDDEAMLLASIDVQMAREKKLVLQPGKYEVDRIGDRRPDLYGRLTRQDP